MKLQECSEEAKKTPEHGQRGCLVLYSGGLDSILACRVLQEQGIRVTALKFTTPFFGHEAASNPENYIKRVKKKYGVDLSVIDITDDYLPMLRNPPHGYGKNFNPCIDCKILMVHKALELMPHYEADFIATGEVIGQRPMSQRKDTLNCITNESLAKGLLLRPLCAASLKPTIPETEGWVDRDKLPHISGRGRKIQMELAEKYCITDYPSPGGGCMLADPILGKRLKKYFETWKEMDGNDCRLAVTGRQFILPGGWWFVLGRDARENSVITSLKRETDLFLDSLNAPAPSGIVRKYGERVQADEETARLAASIIRYYCKKCSGEMELKLEQMGEYRTMKVTEPLAREELSSFMVETE